MYKATVSTNPGFIFVVMLALYSTVALMFLVLLAMLFRCPHASFKVFLDRITWLVGPCIRFVYFCLTVSTQEDCLTEDSAEVEHVLVVVWSGLVCKDSQDDLVPNCILYG